MRPTCFILLCEPHTYNLTIVHLPDIKNVKSREITKFIFVMNSYFFSFPDLQKLTVKTLELSNLFQAKFHFHFRFHHSWLSFLSQG